MAGRHKKHPSESESSDPAHRKIANDLRKRLLSGEWAGGETLPSLRALSTHYDVGQNTIRLAVDKLKAEGRIRINAKRRMVAARQEDVWCPTARLILFVIADRLDSALEKRFLPAMINGVQVAAGPNGAALLMLHGHKLKEKVPEEALDMPITGAILLGAFSERCLEQYARLGVPVVLLDGNFDGPGIHSISSNYLEAGRESAHCLISRGHTRIAYLRTISLSRGSVDPEIRDRQEGIFQVLKEQGLPSSGDQVFNSLHTDTPDSQSIQAVLKWADKRSAVIASGLFPAWLLYDAARNAGLSIPEDLIIICFQEEPAHDPRFAGVRVDFREMGLRAFDLLSQPKHPPQTLHVHAQWRDGPTLGPTHQLGESTRKTVKPED